MRPVLTTHVHGHGPTAARGPDAAPWWRRGLAAPYRGIGRVLDDEVAVTSAVRPLVQTVKLQPTLAQRSDSRQAGASR